MARERDRDVMLERDKDSIKQTRIYSIKETRWYKRRYKRDRDIVLNKLFSNFITSFMGCCC